jgi:hypothetical protein
MAESTIDSAINQRRAVCDYDGAIEICEQGIKLCDSGISECNQMERGLYAFMQYMTDAKHIGREITSYAGSANHLQDDVGRLLVQGYLECGKRILEQADSAEGEAEDQRRWYMNRRRQLIERKEELEETRQRLLREKAEYERLKRQAEARDDGYSR